MRILHETLELHIQEQLKPERIGAEIIEKHLRASGIHLTKAQKADLRKKLKHRNWEGLALNLEDSQVPVSLRAVDKNGGPAIAINVSDSENTINDILSQFEAQVTKAIPQIVAKTATLLQRALKREAHGMLLGRRKDRDAFEARLVHRWRKPLDLLETIIAIAAEAGADFNQEWRPSASVEKDYAFDALIRLHARACQIASEVLTLLRCGYADGAHARWRSLHELTVVALFISQNGRDVAEQYLLHDTVESYKAAEQYQKYAPVLGYEPFTGDELRKMRERRDAAVQHFGKPCGEEYGWAVKALNRKCVTFCDIERAVGLQHWRPFYKMACQNVHANAKGLFMKLGLHPQGPDYLLAGASNFGLADPGHGTAISLSQITTALLVKKESLDNLVMCEILQELQSRCGEAFLKVQKKLEIKVRK
jgi:hypothetical protein